MQMSNLYAEIARHKWAITQEAYHAIVARLETGEFSADDHRYFHAVDREQKLEAVSNFGARVEGSRYSSIDKNVGYLLIDGPIIPRATWFSDVSGLTSLDVLTSEFKAFEANPYIDSIVMLIDSPGGVITGVSDFSNLIRASSKRVVAWAWMAASAAYDLAAAAGEIVAPSSGLVGSIGTVLSLTDSSEADAKRGIRTTEIWSTQSPYKRVDANTPEGRAVYQQVVDDLADEFIARVALHRGVSVASVVESFGRGSIVVAGRALAAGMIDRVSDFESFQRSLRPGFVSTLSASAGSTLTEVDVMATANQVTKKTAAELREEQPEAVGEIAASAKAEERNRIQAIEGISAQFDNSLPAVKAAVKAAIDERKYAADATVESVAVAMLGVVAKAQVAAVEEIAKPRREAATVAAEASKATPAPTGEAAEAAVVMAETNRILKAMDQVQGRSS